MTTRKMALLHAQLETFDYKVKAARDLVRKAIKECPEWYVAFSGGKDSTCVLALVREVLPEAPAVISIHKWRLPETTEYLAKIPNLHYIASGSDHKTGWGKNWESQEEADAHFPGIPWFDKNADRESFGRSEGGVFLGLRKFENSYRRKYIGKYGPLHFVKCTQKWHCNPIAHWSAIDVWAFIHSSNLEYNHAYDVMEQIGIPLKNQRVGPLAVGSVLGYGQLAILKRGWPSLFREYQCEHPEANGYV